MSAFYLLLDAGNTRVKWLMLAADQVSCALAPELPATPQGARLHADCDQLAADWRAALAAQAWQGRDCRAILGANVAGPAMRTLLEQQLQAALTPMPALEWFAASPARAGLRNDYENPLQLGCDRFAAAIGAHALWPGKHLLVANCGTATTLDAVSADGVFTGGMIAPGLLLMARSLSQNTAQLPEIDPQRRLIDGFARNTQEAILAGCITAQAGAIEKAVRQLEHRLAQAVHCILSGGAAPYLAPALGIPYHHLDNLVLRGLLRVLQTPPYSVEAPC
ncbi:type III pantothenate kinase [Massilia sp. W12]|uniref:type III pantothenate kinase n=1 Tax=Massilia sp. W12 TaxID=3126507 RepID=UPI0030D2A9B8